MDKPSIQAEVSLIGNVLVDPEGFDRVRDLVSAEEFFDPRHAVIWNCIGSMAEPVDIVTLAEALERAGKLDAAGGLAYLGTIRAGTSAAANTRAYAKAIRDHALLRALVRTGAAQVDAVHNPNGRTAQELLSESQRALESLSFQRSSGWVSAGDATTSAIARIETLLKNGGGMVGVSTGFKDLDKKTRGLEPGTLTIIAARPSMGKAQPIDSKILTLSGWKTMGEVQVGDALASIDGGASYVSGVFPQGKKQIYRITFADGRSAECCDEHLWLVNNRHWITPKVLSTRDLITKLEKKRYQGRLWIDTFSGHFGGGSLPIDPWVMGAVLGNGGLSGGDVKFSTADIETFGLFKDTISPEYELKKISNYGYRVIQSGGCHEKGILGVKPNGIKESLKTLGLHGLKSQDKFIPQQYLNASFSDRMALMQGLMDTDGWVEKTGAVCFSTSSKNLADDFIYLARSLGCTASYSIKTPVFTYRGLKKTGLESYCCRVQHKNKEDLFRLRRKSERAKIGFRVRRLTVSSIQPTRVANAQCIKVTHPSSTYITNDFVVTHNTTLGMQIARHVAETDPRHVAVFSLEMSAESLAIRMMSALGGVDHDRLRSAQLGTDDYEGVTRAASRLGSMRLHIDDTSGLTSDEIQARAKRLHRETGGLSLIVIDYLGLIGISSKAESHNLAIGKITAEMKGLAKTLKVPVVLLSQLNRGLEQRPNKRPILADIRESGHVEQDADLVMFIYRDEVYYPDSQEAGIAEIIIGKQRNGPIGTIRVAFKGELCRFADLAYEWRAPAPQKRYDNEY